MKRSFRILILAVCCMLLISLTACTKKPQEVSVGTEEPTITAPATELPAKPTDTAVITLAPTADPIEPAVTTDPVSEITPAPETPAVTESTAPETKTPVFEEFAFEAGLHVNVDIDQDGASDIILLRSEKTDEYSAQYILEVTLGCAPEKTYEVPFEDNDVYYVQAFVTDADENDGRLDIVICYTYSSDDCTTVIYRVNEELSGIDSAEYFMVPIKHDDGKYVSGGLLKFSIRTEILGTSFVYCEFRMENGELVRASDVLSYDVDSDDPRWVPVIKDISVRLINDDGEAGDEAVLPEGVEVFPIETDGESYVKVGVSTGGEAIVFFTMDEYGIIPMINDLPQHEYFFVLYAD